MGNAVSFLAFGLLLAAPLRAQTSEPDRPPGERGPTAEPSTLPPIPPVTSPPLGYPAYGALQYGYAIPARTRTGLELGLLYATAALYGIGIGVWIGAEADIDDPGLFLIAPAVLGVAAPAAVYAFDRNPLPRGVPAVIATGALIGAGEGVGIVTAQSVTASKKNAWGFRGLARATAIGATLGAGGGILLGIAEEPSPRSSLFVTSAVAWGAAVGTMLGYGSTRAGIGYGAANDSAAWGGLIGYNVGLAVSASISTFHIPTFSSIQWMWAGAGIGFAASLPVYVAYAGDGGPPVKRGLLFSGTATALGAIAGALFTAGDQSSAAGAPALNTARITSVVPLAAPSALGLAVAGEL